MLPFYRLIEMSSSKVRENHLIVVHQQVILPSTAPTDIATFRNDVTKDEGKAFNETVISLHIRYNSFKDLPFMIGCN